MSEHDITRKMLELIRESDNNRKNKLIRENKQKSRLLREADESKEDKDLDPSELSEEEKKFRDTVTPRVKFNRFRLYPKAQNVEFSGKFTDSSIEWFYSLDDTRGVYITADLLQLNDQTLTQIQKLVAYYESWANEWATKIAEEYKNDTRDEENEETGPEPLENAETGEEEVSGAM